MLFDTSPSIPPSIHSPLHSISFPPPHPFPDRTAGAIVLAGWAPLPWGHHGDGPSPPSLDALYNTGQDMEVLEAVMDNLFNLDDASPPMLLSDGALRPLLRAAFASMIMYHPDRMAAGEMRPVCMKLLEAVGKIGISTPMLCE